MRRNKTHSVAPLLVRVVCRTRPNLQLRPVNKPALRDIQALVAEHFDNPSAKGPLLRSRPGAWLNGNDGGVGIGGGGQAFRCIFELESKIANDMGDDDLPLLRPGSKRSSPLKLQKRSYK